MIQVVLVNTIVLNSCIYLTAFHLATVLLRSEEAIAMAGVFSVHGDDYEGLWGSRGSGVCE